MSDAPTTTTTDVLEGVDLSGRTVLVTGATTGIGRETARALAAAGASVVITARSDDKGAATVAGMLDRVPGADVSYEVLELGSLDSVRAFTDRFTATHDRLDVLIGNAGIMAVPFGRTDDGFELQFGTNHLGHFDLVGRLLPLLRGQRAVARRAAQLGRPHGLRHPLGRPQLRVPRVQQDGRLRAVEDGQHPPRRRARAALRARSACTPTRCTRAWSPPSSGATSPPTSWRTSRPGPRRRPSGSGKLPPVVGTDVGAATSVWAATAPELDAQGGTYLADCAVATAAPYAMDLDAAARLWALSEELVGETFPAPAAPRPDPRAPAGSARHAPGDVLSQRVERARAEEWVSGPGGPAARGW